MMEGDKKDKIELDIDRNRIRTILSETYNRSQELLGIAAFNSTLPDFLSKIEPYLLCNRISTVVSINLPSNKIPDLRIEVNIRKKSIFARTIFKSKQILLNRYLKTL